MLAGEVKEAKKRMQECRRASKQGACDDANQLAKPAIAKPRAANGTDRGHRQPVGTAHRTGDELKKLKANIREVEKQKDEMVAAARAKISEEEAKQLILERFQRLLIEQFDGYLRQYQRAFIAAVENLWDKYAVTTKQILAERDREAAQLDAFLKELGYE